MGLFDFLKNLVGLGDNLPPPNQGHSLDELARRLDMSVDELAKVTPAYHTFNIPKRTGGARQITAPDPGFKNFQRRLLRRVLRLLPAHPAALGFRKGHGITSHALLHAMRPVIIKMDIRDFFPNTTDKRVHDYFRIVGWNEEAATLITDWCTWEGGLPQGAPTSPCLSNVVNYHLDTRMAAMVRMLASKPRPDINPKTLEPVSQTEGDFIPSGGYYSRYADDMTISFDHDNHARVNGAIYLAKEIVSDVGYRLHTKKKLRIMRRCDRQMVTGLVVNDGIRLPRETRRWLRAVRHRAGNGGRPSLSPQQLAGWEALEKMIDGALQG